MIFCCSTSFFALLAHYWCWKLKFGKNVKNLWRYYPFTHVFHKSRSYDVWFLRYKDRVFVILGHFLPFDPPNNPENQSFEKMKKASGDIIILHSCTTKDHHIMYGSQDIQCNRQTFLSFWAIFCSFTP